MQTILFQGSEIVPSKVVCVGRNYVEHIHELGNEMPEEMVLFNKPNSSVTDTLYYFSADCRFEGEICFLVEEGRFTGVGIGLDLTKADVQNRLKSRGLPWERAKAFDNAAVFSPFVPLAGDIRTIEMRLWHNATLRQHATYDLMIYKPQTILEEIQRFMRLEDGDIVMSGTPKGVTTYQRGDTVETALFMEGREIVRATFTAQ